MIDFTVRPDSGDEFEVTATSRDVYAWEKTGKGKSFTQLTENMQMGELYRLAHLAARRRQLFTGDLEQFVESCDLVIGEDEEEEPDPTPPEA